MSRPRTAPPAQPIAAAALMLAVSAFAAAGTYAQSRARVRLAGHLSPLRAAARRDGAVAPNEPVRFAITLPLRSEPELEALISHVSNPNDPQYGQYLSADEFAARFSPTQAQYDAVAQFARAQGLTVTGTHPNRTILDVSGTAAAVEQAFNTRLGRFATRSGQSFRAPEVEPSIPSYLRGVVSGVAGLDDLPMHPHLRIHKVGGQLQPHIGIGTGQLNGLTPKDIKTAYNLNSVTGDGTGQTLALMELDGYDAADITKYEDTFSLPHVPLQNILLDGFNGTPGSGQDEVTLDIELQIALAPGISKILVYEAPNTGQGLLDCFNRIATDNTAKSISCSWGLAETVLPSSFLNSNSGIFKQFAVQGQSVFSASGDDGAFDDDVALSVDNPASQPFGTGVGGTKLATVTAGGAWKSESSWNQGSVPGDSGGGGGISVAWPIPSYQVGLVGGTSTKGSTTARNVPDVALDAQPDTGYAIFSGGQWILVGGTSCAAPLWSAFAAVANQKRVAANLPVLGFMNPLIYETGKAKGAADFHDIADSTTNLFYPAVSGYDCSTGWGSFNGAALMTDITTVAATKFTVSGVVVRNGAGVPGVRVTVGTASDTTDATGAFSVPNLKAGTYTVTPSADGFSFNPSTRSVTVGPNAQGVNFLAVAIPTFTVTGQVTDGIDALAGVTITAGTKSATSGSDGSYTLSNLPAGTYAVTATLSGYGFTPASQSITVGPDATNVDFTGQRNAFDLSGTVTLDGRGLRGVTISIPGVDPVTTDSDGFYLFSALPKGTYTLTPSRANFTFSPIRQRVTLDDDLSDVDFEAAPQTFQVSGQVTLNGAGVSGVEVSTSSVSTTTDGSGKYTLSGLAQGTYAVSCSSPKLLFSPASRPVTVGPDATGLNFTAQPVFDVSGKVTVNGTPLSGVTLSTAGKTAISDASGRYTISGLPSGPYTVTPSLFGFTFTPVPATFNLIASRTDVDFAATQQAQLKSFTLKKGSVTAGQAATGVVTLNIPAPANLNVSFFSSAPDAARLPGSILIPKGKSSGTVTITTAKRRVSSVVNVQATAGGTTGTATLNVQASK